MNIKDYPYLLDIPADEYHAATKAGQFVTSHQLNVFRRCPLEYIQRKRGIIVEKDTANFIVGRAVHTLTLEGREAFDREYTVGEGPVNPKTGKPYGTLTAAYKDWAAQQPHPVIATGDFEMMEKLREAVQNHPIAADLLKDGIAEATIRADWNGVPCQSRLDWFDPSRGILADLKTCQDVDRFPYDVRDFGYVTQLAFYRHMLYLAGYTEKVHCFLIAVEKKEPYRVAVAKIYDMTVNEGNTAEDSKYGKGNELCLEELKVCQARDDWPTRYEELMKI